MFDTCSGESVDVAGGGVSLRAQVFTAQQVPCRDHRG